MKKDFFLEYCLPGSQAEKKKPHHVFVTRDLSELETTSLPANERSFFGPSSQAKSATEYLVSFFPLSLAFPEFVVGAT
jgi:hypothetical protein